METRAVFYMDKQSKKAIAELKRPFKASALIRWLLKALTTTNKEWDKLIVSDPEVKAVQDFLRPRLRHALGFDEEETTKRKS